MLHVDFKTILRTGNTFHRDATRIPVLARNLMTVCSLKTALLECEATTTFARLSFIWKSLIEGIYRAQPRKRTPIEGL
jgi:hypothetical protein